MDWDLLHSDYLLEAKKQHFELTPNALVISAGNRQTTYGRWGRVFGCWHKESSLHLTRQILPKFPLLTISGGLYLGDDDLNIDKLDLADLNYLHLDGEQHEKPAGEFGLYAHDDAADIECAQRFIESIPLEIRMLCAPFRNFQWAVLEAINHTHGFLALLHREYSSNDISRIILCFMQAKIFMLSKFERENVYIALAKQGSVKYLKSVVGICPPDDYIGCLIQRKSFSRNFKVTKKDVKPFIEAATILRFVKKPHPYWLITTAVNIPNWARHPNLFAYMTEDNSGYVTSILQDANALASDELRTRIQQSIRDIRSIESLENRAAAWDDAIWNSKLPTLTTFPPPPHPGNTRLRPITSPNALAHEGKTMNNCAASYVRAVAEGTTYFYHYRGKASASVRIGQGSEPDTWAIREIRGYNNSAISIEAQDDIFSILNMETHHYG